MLATASAQVCVPLGYSSLYLVLVLGLNIKVLVAKRSFSATHKGINAQSNFRKSLFFTYKWSISVTIR